MTDNETENGGRSGADAGLAFFGRISASVSHEINNVLTSITEVAGLLDDLAAAASQGSALDPLKISKNIDTISRQTARGVAIIKNFNRFAHSADEPVVNFDAGAALENLCSICRRLTDIKNLKLEFAPPPAKIMMTSSPFILQQAVFGCISAGLAGAERGGTVSVSAEEAERNIVVSMKLEPVADPEAACAALDKARAAAALIGGYFEESESADGTKKKIVLTFGRGPAVAP